MPRPAIFADRLHWGLLHTFLVIAEEKSLSRAALRLNVTPSAVSHSLRRLEEQTGGRLVDRNRQRFALTGQGALLHEAALDICKRINVLDTAFASGMHAISGTLNLLILSTLVSDTFDIFLTDFCKRFPMLAMQVETLPSSIILKRIGQNLPAVGLALCPQEGRDIRRAMLIPQRYALYCGRSHPLFTQERVSSQDLLAENFVSFFSDQMGDSLAALAEYREKHRFTGRVVASANNQHEVKRLLYAGYGIGCLADDSARKDVLEGRLRRLPPEKGIADVPVYLVWSGQRKLQPAEIIFINGLCDAFGRERPFPAAGENSRAAGA